MTTEQDAANRWPITISIMLATVMNSLDTTIANVALPHIAGSLSTDVDESTWVLTSYLVSNAIVLPVSGWLALRFGRKRFFMVCIALFTFSSLACGSAKSLGVLILFRILQGVGGGALQPISQAILLESFPRRQHGMAMATFGIGVVIAPIVGPTLGGWLTDNYTWRWCFYINLPVGLLALMLIHSFVFDPEYIRKFRSGAIDYIGLGLLAVGLGCLQITLDKGQREDWFQSAWLTKFAVTSAVALVLLVIWELHVSHPVVDLRVLRDRNLSIGTAIMFAFGSVLYGSLVLYPILTQTMLGYTAYLSGLVLSPGGVATFLFMPICGRLIGVTDPRRLIAGGLGVKLADPSREVYVMVGDGSYLMMNSEIATMVQEGIKVTIVLLDNHGFASIGSLSESVGSGGFGTEYRLRDGQALQGEVLPIDYVANAASLGAHAMRATTREELASAIEEARKIENRPVCIVVETDREQRVGNYGAWWDVPVAEVASCVRITS